MNFGSHTITVIRPAGPDPFGDPRPGGTETVVPGCYVQPRSSTESTDLRDTVVTGWTAFVPPVIDVVATDQIRWNGDLYAVDGEPSSFDGPDGVRHHQEVPLRRVEG